MLFFIVVPFCNAMVLLGILIYEFKRMGIHFGTFADKRILIFAILMVM